MPAEQVKKMQDAVHQAVNDPAINKRMRELYAIPKTGTPEQARARMQSDLKFWKKVIADNNIKV
jgi:tripartite-type tricarboxylate transporter receptor subunit TctC